MVQFSTKVAGTSKTGYVEVRALLQQMSNLSIKSEFSILLEVPGGILGATGFFCVHYPHEDK